MTTSVLEVSLILTGVLIFIQTLMMQVLCAVGPLRLTLVCGGKGFETESRTFKRKW